MSELKDKGPEETDSLPPSSLPAHTGSRNPSDTFLQAERPYWLALLLVVWLGNYLYFWEWGFYADDWMIIGNHYTSFAGSSKQFELLGSLLNWPSGRPLGFFFPNLAGIIGAWAGSITLLYVFGAAILYLNALLLFLLFKTWVRPGHAFLVALFYLLCPLDTTRMLLTHSFQLQLSLCFALAGMLLIARGRPMGGYAVGSLSLLTYETGFLALAAAPFFHTRGVVPGRWKTYLLHYAVLAAILVLYLSVRAALGESRLAGVGNDPWGFAWQSLQAVLHGLDHAWRIVVLMVQWPWHHPALMGFVLAAAILCVVYACYRKGTIGSGMTGSGEAEAWSLSSRVAAEMFFVAVLTILASYLFAAYLFSEYGWSMPLAGRGTRLHGVAAIGYAVTVATLLVLLLDRLRRGPARAMALLAAALVVAWHAYYAEKIQSDYSRAWRDQRHMLMATVPLVLDHRPGQVVLYDDTLAKRGVPQGIASRHWAYNIFLTSLVDWDLKQYLEGPVVVPVTRSDWLRHIAIDPRTGSLRAVGRVRLLAGVPGVARLNWRPDNVTVVILTRTGFKRFRFATRNGQLGLVPDPVRYNRNDAQAMMNRPLQPLARILFTRKELYFMGLGYNLLERSQAGDGGGGR